MPNPKWKHSKSRRDKRRTHVKLFAPNFGNCPQCSEPKLPHRVCLKCGYYKGKEVLPVIEV